MSPTVSRARTLRAAASVLGIVVASAASAERPVLVLEGAARLVMDLNGGAIGEFRPKESAVNPLNWGAPKAGDDAVRGFGHFLCLDRWGPPSDAEGRAGMPYHGEAAHVAWRVVAPVRRDGDAIAASASAELPLAGLSVRRDLRMPSGAAYCLVTETVANTRPVGRVYNMVQHPTISPPFLDEGTLVDCNGRRGFAQGNPMPHPEEPTTHWPVALTREGAASNLRELKASPDPAVATFAIDGRLGWITASNPRLGLLLGYAWPTADYPWVSVWRDARDGKPSARGLEFGTTGLHRPFADLTEVGRLWGRPVQDFLDAGATRTRRFAVFAVAIPADFAGVGDVTVGDGRLEVVEREGGKGRRIGMTVGKEVGL